jgi:16S rRNA processing protein RimM
MESASILTSSDAADPAAPAIDDLLLIGTVVGTTGLRGHVRLRVVSNDIERICRRVRTLYIGSPPRAVTLRRGAVSRPGVAVLQLAGIETTAAAAGLRGSDVYIHQRDAAPLGDGEYFIHDLLGARVWLEDGSELGQVRDVIETGANDVLVVARRGAPEALIPMIREVVVGLQLAERRIVIRPLAGLL